MFVQPTRTPNPTPVGYQSPIEAVPLDMGVLITIGTQAAQAPFAPTPNSVVTLHAPGQ